MGWSVGSGVGSRVGPVSDRSSRPLVGLVFPDVGGAVGCLEGGEVVGLKVGLEVGASEVTIEGALEGLDVTVGAEVGLVVGFLLVSNT